MMRLRMLIEDGYPAYYGGYYPGYAAYYGGPRYYGYPYWRRHWRHW